MADNQKQVWSLLKQNTSLSDESIAGIMGNLQCESNNEACRKQGDFTSDRKASKEYASAVDNGTMTK